ncbi:MAG: hypothetical protein V3T86_01435 [Planctomycetota bacterium]
MADDAPSCACSSTCSLWFASSAQIARGSLLNLRKQINVLKRSVKRARINDGDRMFWVLMHRLFADWKEHLVVVKPQTVIRWHRQGFRCYWKWKSRPKGGRPAIAPDGIDPAAAFVPRAEKFRDPVAVAHGCSSSNASLNLQSARP